MLKTKIYMRILAIADLHGFTLDEIDKIYRVNPKNIDLIVWLGDNDSYVIDKIRRKFEKIKQIGVLGNYETHDNLTKNKVLNIDKKYIEINEVGFVGFEGCFKENIDSYKYGYTQIESILTAFSLPKADVVISHTSPMGINQNKPTHPGLIGISDYIRIHKPKLVLHGHQHINKKTVRGKTTVIGVFGAQIIDSETMDNIVILGKK